jgi:acyl carrier protein
MEAMMSVGSATLEGVKDVIVETLGIEERRQSLEAETALFGGIPELDSLAVVELAVAIENRFGIVIEDEDFGGEVFESIGSLAELVDHKLAAAS